MSDMESEQELHERLERERLQRGRQLRERAPAVMAAEDAFAREFKEALQEKFEQAGVVSVEGAEMEEGRRYLAFMVRSSYAGRFRMVLIIITGLSYDQSKGEQHPREEWHAVYRIFRDKFDVMKVDRADCGPLDFSWGPITLAGYRKLTAGE